MCSDRVDLAPTFNFKNVAWNPAPLTGVVALCPRPYRSSARPPLATRPLVSLELPGRVDGHGNEPRPDCYVPRGSSSPAMAGTGLRRCGARRHRCKSARSRRTVWKRCRPGQLYLAHEDTKACAIRKRSVRVRTGRDVVCAAAGGSRSSGAEPGQDGASAATRPRCRQHVCARHRLLACWCVWRVRSK